MPTCKTVRRLYCIEASATDKISSAASSALGIVRDIRHHSPMPDDHQFLFDVLEALFATTGHDLAEHVHGCAEQCAICAPIRDLIPSQGIA